MKDGYDGLITKLALVAIFCLAGPAQAQGEVPLTPEHTCHYSTPNEPGQGMDLRILPATETDVARVFGTLYVGAIPQYYRYAPSWFTVQGGFEDGDGVSQTIPVGHVGGVTLGQPGLAYIIKYGDIRLTATGPDTIVGELTLDGGSDSPFSPNVPILVTFNFRCLVR